MAGLQVFLLGLGGQALGLGVGLLRHPAGGRGLGMPEVWLVSRLEN